MHSQMRHQALLAQHHHLQYHLRDEGHSQEIHPSGSPALGASTAQRGVGSVESGALAVFYRYQRLERMRVDLLTRGGLG